LAWLINRQERQLDAHAVSARINKANRHWIFGGKEGNHATTEISRIRTIKNAVIKNYNKCIITNGEPIQNY